MLRIKTMSLKEKKYMNFNEMLECLEKGEKVRLSTWQENNYIGSL